MREVGNKKGDLEKWTVSGEKHRDGRRGEEAYSWSKMRRSYLEAVGTGLSQT